MLSPKIWTISTPKISMVVGMGDMLVSNDQNALLLTYSLGSCVGITIWDPVVKTGGLLHAMLPDSSLNEEKAKDRPYMFVDTGLPALFHAVYELGGVKSRLVVKIAGGAEVLNENKFFNIGAKNLKSVKEMLARNGVRITAEDTGGMDVRTLRLDLASGELFVAVTGKATRCL